MASLYERASAKVAEKFAQYGTAITYTRPGTPIVNGATGAVTPGTPQVFTGVRVVCLPVSKASTTSFDNKLEDLSLKGVRLKYLQIAATDLTIEPKSEDKVTLSGVDWKVLGCTPVDPSAACPLVYGVGLMAL